MRTSYTLTLILVSVFLEDLSRGFELPHALAELPPTFHNYLDDFLQAIRVFGFVSATSTRFHIPSDDSF